MTEVKYCPSCGTKLDNKRIEGRTRQYCNRCDEVVYQNPKPCAGVLVVENDSVLLIQRTTPPAVGSWSLPAGYLEYDEPPQRAAVRELREETGLQTDPEMIDLFDTQFVSHEDTTHVLVLLYVVSRAHTEGTPAPGTDAGDARFWTYSALTSDAPLEAGYREIFRRVIREYGSENPY